jgi:predicted P-loop ATPase
MKLNIAIGKSRLDKKWKNTEIEWNDFVKRVSKTHRTVETVDEYASFKRDRQDEIKDVGGFVGGYLAQGRRLVSSVLHRQMMTLDADEATIDFWQKFCLQYNCEALIYSTHKHTNENPRFRLVIPLEREVFQDEYYAIARRIAGDVGIDMFDATGYQPHRLMYWPSTSCDGHFVFEHQKGKFLNPDDVLARYVDWTDVSAWPIGKREKKIADHSIKKQGEPSEKPGLIGAFNRAYTIEEAIEKFLSDVYEKSDIKDRYTYKEGSTASGVIVYDNKFIYSHHSTDPTNGILCNAFDMVRLHKFGIKDSDDEEIPVNKRPSYLAMSEFASKDKTVAVEIGQAKLDKAKEAFEEAGLVIDDEVPDTKKVKDADWLKKMDIDTKGNLHNTLNNIALVLDHDPAFSGNLVYDEFEGLAFFKRALPWRKICENPGLSDNDLANIENHIERIYKITTGSEKLKKGLSIIFEKNKIHSVRDYLSKVKWDGKKRVDTLLIDFMGAEDSEYMRAITRKTLAACVGIKFDNILTLVGEEGQGKSRLFAKLGGQWFSDTFNLHMLQSKEAYEQIQGVWIIEIPELSGLAKAEVERVKGFISATQDRYRGAYARITETRKRQCVFVASTNLRDFLKSQTGNRRFWPVETFINEPKYNVHLLKQEDIDLIWAEAVMIYNQGETLYLEGEVLKQATLIQTEFTEENPLISLFEEYLSMDIPKNWYDLSRWDKIEITQLKENRDDYVKRKQVCAQELWEIAMGEKNKMTIYDLKNIKLAMSKIKDWQRSKDNLRFGKSYPRQRGAYVFSGTDDRLSGTKGGTSGTYEHLL